MNNLGEMRIGEPAEDRLGDVFARDAVRIERLMTGPIERVWSYLIDPDKRRSWFGGGEIEPRVGGNVEIQIQNADLSAVGDLPPPKYAEHAGPGQILGRVTACEPPHLFGFRWEHGPELVSDVRIELEPKGDKVLLRLTHTRLPSRDALVSVSAGWHTHLGILEATLAGEAPDSFWRSMTRLDAVYDQRIPPW
ncbi:SRPBCC family protein [Kaistia terrae]|uniref:SRPBCC family protein n=1 Tax=Kaistia terrae TaxID=537017 RepID=A0ABW0PZA7_9HYPH|nr:SRPBCC family protein [Kaistia terrae]MCX5581413.1 SRPBCC family protein [Kaistia terrae]